jgi:serine/threonine protein kinase
MPFSEREARARQALRGLRERPLPEIPRYEIRALLGEGASASVYRAWDRELGREVALKVLRGGRSGERFRREARAVAALSHPNVVAVHDAGEADGRLYLVLELVEGGPLRTRLREPDAAALLEQAARGVAAAHGRGLVHRDVTPANILVSREGAPKVADFGLVHEDAAEALTATGAALGTPPYMAPEQVEGRGVSPATDVYALGAILYEILAGHPPFTASTPHALYAKILNEPPTLLARSAPSPPRRSPSGRPIATPTRERSPTTSAARSTDDRCSPGRPAPFAGRSAIGRSSPPLFSWRPSRSSSGAARAIWRER